MPLHCRYKECAARRGSKGGVGYGPADRQGHDARGHAQASSLALLHFGSLETTTCVLFIFHTGANSSYFLLMIEEGVDFFLFTILTFEEL